MRTPVYLDGNLVGRPGRRYRVHPVEGSDSLLLSVDSSELLDPGQDRWDDALSRATGYRAAELLPSQAWEGDLGVDRIKRRRIAESLGLGAAHAAAFADARTVGESLALCQASVPASAPPAESPVAPAVAWTEASITALLLEVVQAKTGYPPEMLSLDADLEADLGIDSIKQVQIAVELRKRCALPLRQDAFQIRDFPTLRHWVRFALSAGVPSETAGPPIFEAARLLRDWEPASRPVSSTAAVLDPRPWLLTEDDWGLARELGRHLSSRGITFAVLPSESLRARESCLTAFAEWRNKHGEPGTVLHLRALSLVDDAEEDHFEAVHTAFALAQGLSVGPRLFCAVTGEARETDGALAGFCRALALERRDWRVLRIELPRSEAIEEPARLAEALWAELASGDAAGEVLLQGGARLVPRTVEAPWPSMPLEETALPRPGEWVIVSGGARGLAAGIARDLLERTGCSVLACGRSPEAPRDFAGTEYRACDVTDPRAVDRLREELVSRGLPVAGVIHAAGVIEDRALEDKGWESFRRVYTVKVEGSRLLGALARGVGARFYCLFSSVSGSFGAAGQLDYAAANAAAVAGLSRLRRERPELCSFAIAWGAWSGTGMAARTGVASLLEAAGEGALPLVEGRRAFRAELADRLRSGAGGAAPGDSPLERVIRAAPASRPVRSWRLDPAGADAWLADHMIAGMTLVPASVILGELVRAASAVAGAPVAGLREFRVQRAIEVGGPLELRVHARPEPWLCEGRAEVETWIEDTRSGVRHAHAWISLGPAFATPAESPLDAASFAAGPTPSYGPLPHGIPLGSSFHLLTSFDASSVRATFLVPPRAPWDSSLAATLEAAFHASALSVLRARGEALVPLAIREASWSQTGWEPGLSGEVRALALDERRFDLDARAPGAWLQVRGFEALCSQENP